MKRPEPPPASAVYQLPWGAVPIESQALEGREGFRDSLRNAIRTRVQKLRAHHPEGRLPYRVLALSGGGAYGAYGAGVLTGWTATGKRPVEFDVVTGISTGALMATFAFLGPDYDDVLRFYTRVDNKDVYTPRAWMSGLFRDAINDTTPLRELLESYIDDAILAKVAREYRAGRRLFIGTTNLDAQAFTIWDMGAIAASDKPDKRQRYIDVVLASASFPVAFPPVYIAVERDGVRYWQMHVDGGVRESVFFYDFVDDSLTVLAELGLSRADIDMEAYLLNNSTLYAETTYKPLPGKVLSIAQATMYALMRKTTLGSLYRLWVQALISGTDFYLSYIPPEYELFENSLDFDRTNMHRLFTFGYNQALQGKAWWHQPAVTDQEALIQLLNPRHSMDRLEARPELR